MSRGDYVDIWYKTGEMVGKHRVLARGVGGEVEVIEPRKDDLYVIVGELSRSRDEVEAARFAKGEVVAMIEGHETHGISPARLEAKARAKKAQP